MEQAISPRKRMPEAEYLEMERAATERHEFVNGRIIAMAGSSFAHGRITLNLGSRLQDKLKEGRCSAFVIDLKVRTPKPRGYHFPDAGIVCEPVFAPEDGQRTILNPKLLVEVLSESTEAYDRGAKFSAYMSIETFEEYVLVSQTEMHVETRRRQPDGSWIMNFATGPDGVLKLGSLGIEIALSDIYAGVQLPPLVVGEE